MDETATKNVIEAALLAAGRPITFDKLVELFSSKGVDVDRGEIRSAIESLGDDYETRGIELKEVASGYRIQVRRNTRDWLDPLFEERAPRYTRALLETLALVAYRQPITRAEIEDVRGVAVSSNIVRTLIERGWVRVVGYRDVPGKPSMLGTTKEFLDYFGLKRLEDLPPLSEIKDFTPTTNPQSDLVDVLEEGLSCELGETVVATLADPVAGTEEVLEDDAKPAEGESADEDASAVEREAVGEPDVRPAEAAHGAAPDSARTTAIEPRAIDETAPDAVAEPATQSAASPVHAAATAPGADTEDDPAAEAVEARSERAGQTAAESAEAEPDAARTETEDDGVERVRNVVPLRQLEPQQAE